ncbi:MAG: glycosyltransferase, partial [Clostridia bacterium]|nr:glycosyltransferase [Clostridia bacterium]
KNIFCVYTMLDESPFLGKCCFPLNCEKYNQDCGNCPQKGEYPKSLFFDRSRKILRDKEKLYNGFDNVVFTGIPYTVERAKNSKLLRGKRFEVAVEGIDTKRTFFPRNTENLRRELSIPPENKVILNVAQFSHVRKGSQYYLEAARKLEKHADISFVHVGFDTNKSICPKNFIPVSYVKDQDELAAYYSLADLFVCTSFADTLPNTCLEAMACGARICGFNISGIPYCAPAPIGTYVEPKNVDALCEVILNTPVRNEASVKENRLFATENYEAENYYKTLIQVGRGLKQ